MLTRKIASQQAIIHREDNPERAQRAERKELQSQRLRDVSRISIFVVVESMADAQAHDDVAWHSRRGHVVSGSTLAKNR
jgi:hypothetical protein